MAPFLVMLSGMSEHKMDLRYEVLFLSIISGMLCTKSDIAYFFYYI